MKPHIIQRQVFELSTGSVKAGAGDTNAARFQQEIILQAIEACFQDVALADEYIIIDRLEIDLGVFASTSLFEQGYDRLVTMLGAELMKVKTQHATNRNAPSKEIDNYDEIASLRRKGAHGWVIDSAKATYLAFLNFLQTGRLPWWFHSRVHDAMEDQFPQAWILAFTQAEKNELKNIITTSSSAQLRVVNHFKSVWLAEFLEQVGLSGHEGLNQWKLFSAAVLKFPTIRLRLHQNFWISWIATRRTSRPCPDLKLIFEKTLQGQRLVISDLMEALQNACLENIKNAAFTQSSTVVLKELANLYTITENNLLPPKILTDINTVTDDKHGIVSEELAQLSDEQMLALVRSTRVKKPGLPKPEKESELSDDAEMFIPAAGMVLLNPFLVELFTSLDVWRNVRWSTVESPFKALQLLSFVCFGDEYIPEHQLTFLKVLTGIQSDAPLLAQQPLTLKEMESCLALLTAVVEHWKALRNTSADGLREVFLQRPGKLSTVDNGYRLVVERKTHDVLLSHLPWGYSLIKLPWMENMIHVSWI